MTTRRVVAAGSLNRQGEADGSSNNSSRCGGGVASQKAGAGSSRLSVIKERRPSCQKKPSSTHAIQGSTATDRQDSKANTVIANSKTTIPATHRSSISQNVSYSPELHRGHKKASFAIFGRRITSMIKCGLAFQGRRKIKLSNPEEEPNHMEIIHEMPQSPRFSTFMSAEAQYAMMKGYEDKLYEKIAHTNPECRLTLKRNKTPHRKRISIVDQENNNLETENDSERSQRNSRSPAFVTSEGSSSLNNSASAILSSSFSAASSSTRDIRDTTEIHTFSSEVSTPRTVALPSPFLKPLRGGHNSVDITGNHWMMTSPQQNSRRWDLQRSSSLTTLSPELSHRKRLVLTYRLESAMDILDAMKRLNKENPLSPRVFRYPRTVDAVRDFNCWTKVWNKEFKELQAK